MKVLLWIWRIIGPLVMIAGIVYIVLVLNNSDWHDVVVLNSKPTYILGGVCAFIGVLIGFTGWAEEVPPRLFWISGNVDLLDNRLGYALKLGIQFFFLPATIALIISFIFYHFPS